MYLDEDDILDQAYDEGYDAWFKGITKSPYSDGAMKYEWDRGNLDACANDNLD